MVINLITINYLFYPGSDYQGALALVNPTQGQCMQMAHLWAVLRLRLTFLKLRLVDNIKYSQQSKLTASLGDRRHVSRRGVSICAMGGEQAPWLYEAQN